MHFQLRKGIAAIKNRTVKVKMCLIYLALHFLRHQTHAFNTASLLQIFSTRLPQPSLSLTSCFQNIYLSWKLINFCFKWSCLHIPAEKGILSQLPWMVSSKITAAECDTKLHHLSLLRKILEWVGVPDYLCLHSEEFYVSSDLSGLPYLTWL